MSGGVGGSDTIQEAIDELDKLALELGELLKVQPPPKWVPGKKGAPTDNQISTSRSDETQKQVYETTKARLSDKISGMDDSLSQKSFGDPLPDSLKEPVKKYGAAKKSAATAESKGDYKSANSALGTVEEAIGEIETVYEGVKAFDEIRETIRRVESDIVPEYKKHPAQAFMKVAFDAWDRAKNDAETALSKTPDPTVAKNLKFRLDQAERNFATVKRNFEFIEGEFEKFQKKALSDIQRIDTNKNLYKDFPEWTAYETARDEANQKGGSNVDINSLDGKKYIEAKTAFSELDTAIAALSGPAAAKLVSDATGKKVKDYRGDIMKYFAAESTELLKEIGKQPGGPAILDAMVKDIGSKAKTDEQQKFVTAALTARYGPQIEGNFSNKNLPFLYKVLGKVPVSHVEENLKRIKCHKFDDDYVAGDYLKKVIRIGSTMSGGSFKSTTLHEVGHAVDDGKGVMKDDINPSNYGGWRKETEDSVADAIIANFSKELQNERMWSPPPDSQGIIRLVSPPSVSQLRNFLKAVLGGNDNPAMDDDEEGTKTETLKKHKAVTICKEIRLSNKLWDRGNSGAKKNKLGDRVYQQAYKSEWWSYEFAQRKVSRIRDYTFRAPGEWFADAYAAFYEGNLSKKHPLYAWLDADKKSSK